MHTYIPTVVDFFYFDFGFNIVCMTIEEMDSVLDSLFFFFFVHLRSLMTHIFGLAKLQAIPFDFDLNKTKNLKVFFYFLFFNFNMFSI